MVGYYGEELPCISRVKEVSANQRGEGEESRIQAPGMMVMVRMEGEGRD